MSKRVVVVASGETERRALPHLISHLEEAGIAVDVRVPPRHRPIGAYVAERIIKAAWYSSHPVRPARFVVLLDVDQAAPDDVLAPFKERLPPRTGSLAVDVLFAYAQQHLESWYFADSANLRRYLGRSLGSVDTSGPDAIHDPKRHLINLLETGKRFYTARTSEEIARRLDGRTIEQRSPSFRGFVQAIRNGAGASAVNSLGQAASRSGKPGTLEA